MARRFTQNRRALSLRPVDSTKNITHNEASVGVTIGQIDIANAIDAPTNAVVNSVQRSSTIKAIWMSLDFCGLAATGVLQTTRCYLMKNPGNNLTPPLPGTEGSSNEKKFIIKEWSYQTMRNQDGNPPFHWEGWIKIPKRYHRMGIDDRWQLLFASSTAAGHLSLMTIYKWFR